MKRIKSVFVNRHSGIRLGWLMLSAACMYLLTAVGVHELYWHVYRTMMEIWCVTVENIARAPGWVQFLYSWSNVIVQLIQNALLTGFAVWLARLAGVQKQNDEIKKGASVGAGLAAAGVLLIWLILMLTGSVRQGWRMSKPSFSINTLALLLTTASAALAEGCFFYGSVYGMLKKRLPAWAALVIMMVLNALTTGAMLPAALTNGLLTALVCCLLTEKYGVSAAAGFRFVWAYLDQAVFGFAGTTAALYETYPVNLYWLSGGNRGIMNGVLTIIVLAAVSFLMIRQNGLISLPELKKKNKSPS